MEIWILHLFSPIFQFCHFIHLCNIPGKGFWEGGRVDSGLGVISSWGVGGCRNPCPRAYLSQASFTWHTSFGFEFGRECRASECPTLIHIHRPSLNERKASDPKLAAERSNGSSRSKRLSIREVLLRSKSASSFIYGSSESILASLYPAPSTSLPLSCESHIQTAYRADSNVATHTYLYLSLIHHLLSRAFACNFFNCLFGCI